MPFPLKKNLLLLSATISLVALILITPYYRHIATDLLDDLRFISLHWNSSTEEKYDFRFGDTFTLLNNIAKRTPPDAIIIMPPDSVLLNSESMVKFHKEVIQKSWASYFVYPRVLVYEKEKNTNPLYEKANYVVILNGWGLDKIQYKLDKKIVTGVLPINPLHGAH